MLVEELDVPDVDALRNLLAHLVRTPPLNHVELRPAVFRLCARRGAHEERVFELPL